VRGGAGRLGSILGHVGMPGTKKKPGKLVNPFNFLGDRRVVINKVRVPLLHNGGRSPVSDPGMGRGGGKHGVKQDPKRGGRIQQGLTQ